MIRIKNDTQNDNFSNHNNSQFEQLFFLYSAYTGKIMKKVFTIFAIFLFLAVPVFAQDLTLGQVQQRIYSGMAQSEVISCLGTPDIVTKSTDGYESWIYERSTKSKTESYDKSWLFLFLFGRRKGCVHTESSGRDLTIILNFDKNNCLKTYAYNSSKF